jgi:hypothetical protein
MSVPTSNPKGIYSAKWINPLYTGPIFTFRRSADNVTRDFYVSEDGALIGDAPAGEGTTLTTWLGASTAYVSKWWDQSSFGNHATQTTNANQPTFNATGKYLQFAAASSQFFNLPDGTVPSGNSNYTVTVKHGTITNTGTTGANSGGVLGSGTASTNSINAFSIGTASTSNYSNYWWSNDFGNKGTYAANNTVTWKYDGINRYLHTNGALTTSVASSGRASGTTNNFIGRGDTVNNNYLDGQLYFVYIYNTNLADADRILVELNAGVSTRTYNLTGAFNTSYPVSKQTLTSPAYAVSCASSDGKNMISIQGTYPNYIILYSNNYGQSWALSNAPVSIYSTAGFSCCSPVNYTNVFYLGAINASFKLFRSADGGVTWTLISTAFTNIAGMCVNNDDTILYLSNFQNAVHYSTRAGNTSFNYTTNTGTFTFTQITNSNNSFQYGKLICSPDGAYLYGTASGSNRAFSYTFSNTSSFNSTLTSAYNTNVYDVAMSSNGSYLYASLFFNANYTIIRSTNGGTSFTDIGTSVITKNIAAYVNCDPTGQYIQVYNSGGAGWWISSDYGASFTAYPATSIPTVPKILTNNQFYSLATNTTTQYVQSPVYPCFLEGSKILRLNPISDQEEYVPIETLREGDLIKTSRNGYKAIFYIGRKTLPSPATDSDIRNRLYRFPRSAHKDMIDDLCITGEHCTLHDNLSSDKLEQVREHMGDVYITEYMIRVPACLDERAEPYTDDTPVTIWHIALENHNIYHNYGIYANGLLVESCSIQYLTELSNMELV